MRLILCTVASDSSYSSDCDSITPLGGARIYAMICDAVKVAPTFCTRSTATHSQNTFHMRSSIHLYNMLLALVINGKAFDS